MTRPSNRELKLLSHLQDDQTRSPDDFVDIGEKTFAGMLKKGWIERTAEGAEAYKATEKGLRIHAEEFDFGRWKR
jgi:hypothetical protein